MSLAPRDTSPTLACAASATAAGSRGKGRVGRGGGGGGGGGRWYVGMWECGGMVALFLVCMSRVLSAQDHTYNICIYVQHTYKCIMCTCSTWQPSPSIYTLYTHTHTHRIHTHHAYTPNTHNTPPHTQIGNTLMMLMVCFHVHGISYRMFDWYAQRHTILYLVNIMMRSTPW